jgi:hypothetical protein
MTHCTSHPICTREATAEVLTGDGRRRPMCAPDAIRAANLAIAWRLPVDIRPLRVPPPAPRLEGSFRRVLFFTVAAMILVGCGAVSTLEALDASSDVGGDASILDVGAPIPDVSAAGAGGNSGAAGSGGAPCTGCLVGATCVPKADQTSQVCGAAGEACAPTKLDCPRVQGQCGAGEELVLQHACDAASSPIRTCCPAGVCLYGCRPCADCF